MKNTLLALILLIPIILLQAHEGDLLQIKNVKTDGHCNHITFEFDIENTEKILLKDVKIVLQSGNIIFAEKTYDKFPLDRITREAITFNAELLKGIAPQSITIDVVEIFGLEKNWGGWHGIDPTVANYNDLGDFEIYADAPWRMAIYDSNNVKADIPIHMLLHDGNQSWLQQNKPNLEFIDVFIKKSNENEFTQINFNDYSLQDFNALFSAKSPNDLSVGIQSFDSSKVNRDVNHTLAFKEKFNTNKNFFFTNLNNPFWYFTLNLPSETLVDFTDEDVLDIRVQFSLRSASGNPYFRNSYLRVFRSKDNMPKLANFYRGDTHVHTNFSQSVLEFGNPIVATKEAAKAIGIDWVIVTDHSSDFENWRGGNIDTTWIRVGNEIDALNAEDPSIPFIKGMEVSLNNAQGELVHFLAYPSIEDPTNLPYLGDGGGDIALTNVTANRTLERLAEIGGFAYAAHPFATNDEVAIIGGNWNVGDGDFPFDGLEFQVGGKILCNKVSAPSDLFSNEDGKLVKDRLKGAQIWGDRFSLYNEEVDAYDPYNIKNANNAAVFQPTPDGNINYLVRYRQGEEVVNFVNLKGIKEKNANPNLKNFKFYFSAGTDAHGSFNYSNTSGFSTAFDDNNVEVKNLAFGNIACVTYCPDGMGEQGEHVLQAMFDGNFTLSDGPILVNGLSLNGTDNQNELMMGMDTVVEITNLENIFANFEYISTPEFGTAKYLKVFFGTNEGEIEFELDIQENLGDNIQLSLNELFTAAGLDTLKNQYFYLRSELQTRAEYGIGNPHLLEFEDFHSFTNPVWLKLIEEDVNVSVENGILKSFKIFPNPANNVVYIEADRAIKRVSIYNTEGKLMIQKRIKNGRLDVSSLATGKYILEANIEAIQVMRSLVIQ